jgi:hypothetical protein
VNKHVEASRLYTSYILLTCDETGKNLVIIANLCGSKFTSI